MRAPARAIVWVLRTYQIAISPLRPPSCRYTPTCSSYAVTAIERFGLVRGGWLALRRLLRCHPFHAGGHDPVPPLVGHSDGSDARARGAATRRSTLPPVTHRPAHPAA